MPAHPSLREILPGLIALVLYIFLVPGLLLVAAGTIAWPMAWVYVILLLASTLGSRLMVLKRNPDTLRERSRFLASEGTKAWDRLLVMIVGLLGPATMALVAGLDQRWGWSAVVPKAVQVLGALGVAAGYGVSVWAMVENAYFSAVARIQEDRGQQVVSSGPYRVVRHPSYAGTALACLAWPVMLDAVWALIPGVAMVMAVVVRTRLEDRMLREELEGYERYAQQTPSRLIPGVW